MRVVGCFLEYNDRFVLLRRLSHKPDGAYKWVSAKEAYELDDLIYGLPEVFRRIGL